MKLSASFILLFLSILISKAQEVSPRGRSIAQRFLGFYQNSQADSIYQLFTDDMKKALSAGKTSLLLNQLKAQFGGLVRVEYSSSKPGGIAEYTGEFEKPGMGLFLYLDQSNRIAGLFVRPHQPNAQQALKESDPDNISLKVKDATLYGTLVMPEGSNMAPVVLIIAGSGPTDRNSNSVLGVSSNSFAMLAESLKAEGIASVRYDKRGVGKSTTSISEAETRFHDMVKDAAGFITLLKKDARFSKVIVCGHSEGSLVGMLAASQAGADAFVSLSGAGNAADVILKKQLNSEAASMVIDSLKNGHQINGAQLPAGISMLLRPEVQPYLRSWMEYNPQAEIRMLKVPILIVQGSTDIQIFEDEAQLLKKAAPSAELKIIEGMNHVLKPAPADPQQNIATYQNPDMALHPELVPAISKFIRNLK